VERNGDSPPRLADGIELIGEYEGSGFREPPSLVRRADGQVIQLTPLLFAVAEQADGSRGYADIASEVSRGIGRRVSAANVAFLVDEKLRPLGVLAAADGSSPAVEKLDPLLALKFRTGVIPERFSQAVSAVFRPLFLPPVILALLAGLVLADVWVFFHHGVAQAIRQAVYQPGTFLLMFAMVVLSAAFHEIGHATGCRYGGGRPGRMGCGLYLAWPAFYTDVTDAYRLGKRGRLRTDLGGVYFNVVVILVTVGAYFVTHFEALLLLVVIQHFEIVHQLLPIVRLDGYYIVADFTGVPDLFTRIKPIFTSLMPGRPADERVRVLKPWVRVAVTVWVLVVVPLLALQLLVILIHLPRILATAWDSGSRQASAVGSAFGSGNVVGGISAGLQLVLLSVPMIGILLMLVRLGQRSLAWMWTRTAGKPVARVASGLALAGLAALLASAWVPAGNYRPIHRGEKGTLAEGITAVRRLPTGHGPLASEQQAAAQGRLGPADPAAGFGTGPTGSPPPTTLAPPVVAPSTTLPRPPTTLSTLRPTVPTTTVTPTVVVPATPTTRTRVPTTLRAPLTTTTTP